MTAILMLDAWAEIKLEMIYERTVVIDDLLLAL